MVPDTLLSHETEEANSKDSTNNTSVGNPTIVSTSTGGCGGLPSESSSTTRSSINATGVRISDATRSAPVGCLAYLRQSYIPQGILLQDLNLMFVSWRDKTNSNYGSSFSKWVNRGVKIPFQDL